MSTPLDLQLVGVLLILDLRIFQIALTPRMFFRLGTQSIAMLATSFQREHLIVKVLRSITRRITT